MKINNKFKAKVFNRAWYLVKNENLSLSESLHQSWLVEKLKYKLNMGMIYFNYSRKDSNIVQACGTLNNIDILIKGSSQFKSDLSTIRYYDLEKRDFRAFKAKNLIKILDY